MRTTVVRRTVIGVSVMVAAAAATYSQSPNGVFVPSIPRSWDDAALSTLEVPLPHRDYSPKAVPADYYYRMPVRPIFKTYPVYVPGKEPKDYLTSLRQLAPEIVWDDKGHRPRLETEADWIKAGELVFDAAIFYDGVATSADVQDPAWHEHVRPLSTPQGVLPYTSYVIRTPGKVELGNNACSFCHTRVMPDGTVIKGAQGNFPFDRAVAYGTRRRNIDDVRTGFRALFAAPWLKDADPAARVAAMTLEELATKFDAVPPGVAARHRASIDSPPAIPDLIGIRERRYLDRTGLVNHRDIGDLMRYAALNNELDFFSRFGDFIPAGTDFRELPPPTDPSVGPDGRYSDEQLYALALYVYSLKPPVNPNPQTPQTVQRRAGISAGTMREMSSAAAVHQQQAHARSRLRRPPRRSRAVCDHADRDRYRRDADAQDATGHRLLQGPLSPGRVVQGAVRAQRLGRDARGLVRSATNR